MPASVFLKSGEKLFQRIPVNELRITRASNQQFQTLISSDPISKLKTLDLSNLRIGDEGAERIANEIQLSNLKRLRLRGCGFTGNGAIALSQSPLNWSLEELDLIHNSTSASSRAQLQERYGSAVKFWHEGENVQLS